MSEQQMINDIYSYAMDNNLDYPDGVMSTLLKCAPASSLKEWQSKGLSKIEQAWNTLQILNKSKPQLPLFSSNVSGLISRVYGINAKEYMEKASDAELALTYLMLTYEDIPKTDIVAEGVKVSVPNVFCDIFKSNVKGDLYDDEVANYAECEFEQDIKTIHTEPEITGLVVGESIVDEFKVKRYGLLS